VQPSRDRKAGVDGEDGVLVHFSSNEACRAAADEELSAMVEVVVKEIKENRLWPESSPSCHRSRHE
jgi:hypothetical protein